MVGASMLKDNIRNDPRQDKFSTDSIAQNVQDPEKIIPVLIPQMDHAKKARDTALSVMRLSVEKVLASCG